MLRSQANGSEVVNRGATRAKPDVCIRLAHPVLGENVKVNTARELRSEARPPLFEVHAGAQVWRVATERRTGGRKNSPEVRRSEQPALFDAAETSMMLLGGSGFRRSPFSEL